MQRRPSAKRYLAKSTASHSDQVSYKTKRALRMMILNSVDPMMKECPGGCTSTSSKTEHTARNSLRSMIRRTEGLRSRMVMNLTKHLIRAAESWIISTNTLRNSEARVTTSLNLKKSTTMRRMTHFNIRIPISSWSSVVWSRS